MWNSSTNSLIASAGCVIYLITAAYIGSAAHNSPEVSHKPETYPRMEGLAFAERIEGDGLLIAVSSTSLGRSVISGSLARLPADSSSHDKDGDAEYKPITVESRTCWTDSKIMLYRDGLKEPVEIAAKKSTYQLRVEGVPFRLADAEYYRIEITAIMSPRMDHAWIGPTTDYYFEMKDGAIVGGRYRTFPGDLFEWRESLLKDANFQPKSIVELICRFEKTAAGASIAWAREHHFPILDELIRNTTDFYDIFDKAFFWGDPDMGGQAIGVMSVREVRLEKGQLMLTLHNATLDRTGTVWIDVKTRKVVRAVEGGEQTYPKPQRK